MIEFVTGNILESNAECLINTVNCEGYMGKGIAYQFKMKYPLNNIDYIKACKTKELMIGKLHYYREDGKMIINFPTKDKWRAKSKMEYVEKGLRELLILIEKLSITSIAIPPLGCGNGGLSWGEVKPVILQYLESISQNVDILIYEPSQNYKATIKSAPKLNVSHLVLMKIKMDTVRKFTAIRLQKTAYFTNLFMEESYFKFTKHRFGPYAHSIDILSKSIKEFQNYYKTTNTLEAYEIAKKELISKSTEEKLDDIEPSLNRAIAYVNSIETDKEVELLATICYIIQTKNVMSEEDVVSGFKDWSEEKWNRFSESDIVYGIHRLLEERIIEKTLLGIKILTYH